MSLCKAAENLVHLPPKSLLNPKSQPQPQMPFPVVRLRHVDGARLEATLHPPPESEDASAASPSRCSAVQFMSRVLQRLREVDEHISEVITVSCFFFCPVSVSALSALCPDPTSGPHRRYWLYMLAEYTLRLMCSQRVRSACNLK